jgi:hypothetical protein
MRNNSTILVGTSEEKRQLGTTCHSWNDNTKSDIKEKVFENSLDLNWFMRERLKSSGSGLGNRN